MSKTVASRRISGAPNSYYPKFIVNTRTRESRAITSGIPSWDPSEEYAIEPLAEVTPDSRLFFSADGIVIIYGGGGSAGGGWEMLRGPNGDFSYDGTLDFSRDVKITPLLENVENGPITPSNMEGSLWGVVVGTEAIAFTDSTTLTGFSTTDGTIAWTHTVDPGMVDYAFFEGGVFLEGIADGSDIVLRAYRDGGLLNEVTLSGITNYRAGSFAILKMFDTRAIIGMAPDDTGDTAPRAVLIEVDETGVTVVEEELDFGLLDFPYPGGAAPQYHDAGDGDFSYVSFVSQEAGPPQIARINRDGSWAWGVDYLVQPRYLGATPTGNLVYHHSMVEFEGDVSALTLIELNKEDGNYVRHYADEDLLDPNEFRDVHTRAGDKLLIRRYLNNTVVMLEFDMVSWDMVGETECYPEFPVEWEAPVGVSYSNGTLLTNVRSLLSTDRSIGWLGDSYVFPVPICELDFRSTHVYPNEHPSLAIPLGGNSVLMYLNRVEEGLIIDPITGLENACICRVTFL